MSRIVHLLVVVLALAALNSCVPVDGGGTSAGGGTGGTGISNGSVTGFGSIFVNGVKFETTGAILTRDGAALPESDLRIGMTVEVRGVIQSPVSGVAESVVVEPVVRGPVEAKGTNQLVVLGQTVLIDDLTYFDSDVPALAQIQLGDILEVHGFVKKAGTINATFIQRRTAPLQYTVRGVVSTHDSVARTFRIGALTLNYSAAITSQMPTTSWNGLSAVVIGSACSGVSPCAVLFVNHVVPYGHTVINAIAAETEGYVTAAVPTGEFTVGHQVVHVNPSTVYVAGEAADIAVGTRLEMEGALVGGVLNAAKVRFKDNIRIELDVLAVSLGAGTLTLDGLSGITVQITPQTLFSGGLSGLGDIGDATHVRLRGRTINPTTVLATQLKLQLLDTTALLQGPVEAVTGSTLTILGKSVNAGAIPLFKDVNDNSISSTAFFDAVAIGKLVKAQGTVNALNAIVWSEIQLQE